MRHTIQVAALLGACEVNQDGGQHGHHLGFYSNLEIAKKRRKLKLVHAIHVKYDMVKHFAAFCEQFVLFSPKKGEKTHFSPKMA